MATKAKFLSRALRRKVFSSWQTWNVAQAKEPRAGKRVQFLTPNGDLAEGLVNEATATHVDVVTATSAYRMKAWRCEVLNWTQYLYPVRSGIRHAQRAVLAA